MNLSDDILNQNLYEILEVDENASAEEIKKSYKRLAKKYHPDLNSDNEKIMVKINNAYDILKDPKKKEEYDLARKLYTNTTFNFYQNDSFTDNFYSDKIYSDKINELFSKAFNNQFNNKQVFEVSIDLEDIYNESTVNIKLPLKTKCDTCKGFGFINNQSRMRCLNCKGTGRKIVNKTFKVKLPAYAKEGYSIHLDENIDLIIHVKQHKLFRVVDYDLYKDLSLTFIQALLGDNIEVPTLKEKIKLNIPAGICDGQKLKVKGKGLNHHDLYFVIKIKMPKYLTENQKKLIQQLDIEEKQY